MKRNLAIMLSVILFTVLLTACGGSKGSPGASSQAPASSSSSSAPESSGPIKTIKLFNFKIEIAEALGELVKEYENLNPNIKIELETVVGADYQTALKTKYAANDMPDIFTNGGYAQLDQWIAELEDLSDQPWVNDVFEFAKEGISKDGKIYGMPVNLEGYGYLYNKELFDKAGITELPKTLTELKTAVGKLESAGITPFTNYFGLAVALGKQFINTPFAKQPDVDQFIKALNDGTASFQGNAIFDNALDLLDLNGEHSFEKGLTTDYNAAIANFAGGKAAMIQSGNWAMPLVLNIAPDFNAGVLPMPLNDDAALNDKLFVGVPVNWVVNAKSNVKPEAKAFLNWLVTSDMGKEYIAKKFKFIPALKTIPIDEASVGTVGADIREYLDAGKVYNWHFTKFPDGIVDEFGATLQKYLAGKANREQVFQEFDDSWKKLKK